MISIDGQASPDVPAALYLLARWGLTQTIPSSRFRLIAAVFHKNCAPSVCWYFA